MARVSKMKGGGEGKGFSGFGEKFTTQSKASTMQFTLVLATSSSIVIKSRAFAQIQVFAQKTPLLVAVKVMVRNERNVNN